MRETPRVFLEGVLVYPPAPGLSRGRLAASPFPLVVAECGSTDVIPAQGYENYMVTALFRPWANRLLDAASFRLADRLIDAGGGARIVAGQIASRLGAGAGITGLDLNSKTLEVARTAAAQEPAEIA